MKLRSFLFIGATPMFMLLLIFGIGRTAQATGSNSLVIGIEPTSGYEGNPSGIGTVSQSSATLTFSDQTSIADVSMTHTTPIIWDEEKGIKAGGAQMISGAAAGDFNNDGWTDLYVIGGGLVPDNLFINQGDGTFVDMAVEAGLAALHMGSGASVGDYNNDGWQDIYVTSFGPVIDTSTYTTALSAMAPGQHLLFRNNGDLTFTNVAAAAGVNQTSAVMADGLGSAFGDYDLDGDLDLFVASWGKKSDGNRLFQNNGDGSFSDVTESAAITDRFLANDGNGIRGFTPCFADMDGDRYPELLLAADFGTSQYYINNGDGTFTEYTTPSGTDQTWSGMGAAVSDVNNDGLLDWYITAIFDDEQVGRGTGSTLYLNQGNHEYEEVANEVGVADGGWGWGTTIIDMNHDTLPDIVGTNGWDLPAYLNEMSKVWLQSSDGSFSEVAAETGFEHSFNGLGLLNLDYDNDGDQDIVVTSYNDELRLFRNDLTGTDTSWLRVFLDTSNAPGLSPNGYGSRIEVLIGNQTYSRYLSGCSHYLTQSELSAHFGLGAAQRIDELRVTWADGSTTVLTDVDVNQTITIPVLSPAAYLPLIATR